MRVLIADSLPDEAVKILTEHGLRVDAPAKLTTDELLGAIPEYEGVIVRSATKLTAPVLQAAAKLKVIARAGAGVDNIDLKAATRLGIIVLNTPGGNTISAAEHTMAMLLALARNIPQAHATLKGGVWDRNRFLGTELSGKVLGIIGLGRIGREVANRARAFEMKVVGFDPYIQPEKVRQIELCPNLEAVLARADFLTVHVPMTAQTKNLIGKREFGLVKPGVRVVNCARGGIMDEAALYEALESGRVAGAALDVFEKEPPGDLPLLRHERVIVTPHLGASTLEAQLSVAREAAELMADALTKGVIRNAVNMPAIDRQTLEEVLPMADLAEQLGAVAAAFCETAPREITITYSGDISKKDTRLLSANCLAGFLRPLLGSKVNEVNAALCAEERGISVAERREADAGPFSNLLELSVKSEGSEITISGTIHGKRDQRIVELDGFEVEFVPRGVILLVHADDKPGFIGSIGQVLGSHGVNIAFMTFGRKEAGGQALAALNLDTDVSPECLSEIGRMPLVRRVKLLRLA